MAFKRIVEMKVGTTSSSVLISDLDITFEISRTREFANNTAKFKIYNPTDDTINRMLKKGNSVVFKAGYDDEGIGLIYIGQITQSIPPAESPDRVVELECGSIQSPDTELENITVSMGFKKGTNVSQPLNEIANALGLATSGFSNLSSVTMPNGFTFAGSIKGAMNELKNVLSYKGLLLFIDNSTMTVSRKDDGDTTQAVYLSYTTGLLEAPKLTDNTEGDETVQKALTKRVLFKSILNYNVKPNGYVQMDTPYVKGTYIVDKCNFSGDNFGGDFYVSGEGLGT